MRADKLILCGQQPPRRAPGGGPSCHRCGRPAVYATIWPSEVRPRAIVFSCNRRHGRAGYSIHLPEVDRHIEHLLSIERKSYAGRMLQAALGRFAEPDPQRRP